MIMTLKKNFFFLLLLSISAIYNKDTFLSVDFFLCLDFYIYIFFHSVRGGGGGGGRWTKD